MNKLLKEGNPITMCIRDRWITIGCHDGIIYTSPLTGKNSITKLPLPPFIGKEASEPPEDIIFSDAIVVLHHAEMTLALMSDKSLVIYDGIVRPEITAIFKSHTDAI